MARTSNIMKNTTSLNKTGEVIAFEVPDVRKNAKNSEVLQAIEAALKGARSMVQSIQELEPKIRKAAELAMAHAEKHGDRGPADRLVKGLIACNHPATNAAAREVIAWFRSYSPIQWEKQGHGKSFANKDPDKGKVDYSLADATATGYYETPAAKRARDASARTHANTLKDADLNMVLKRAAGVPAFVNNILSGKDERHIKEGDLPKIKRFLGRLNEVLKEFGGESAAVPLVKDVKKAA